MEKAPASKAMGFAGLITAMVVGSLMSPTFKTALKLGITPVGVALWRMVFTVALLLVVCRLKKSLWSDVCKVAKDKKLFWTVIAMGVTRGFETICWSMSLSMSGTFVVNILGNITPIFTIILLYVLYREKTSLPALFGIGISLIGVVLIGLNGSATGGASLVSIIIMPLSSLSYDIFLLLGRDVTRQISVIPLMLYVFATSMVMVLCFGTVSGISMALPAPTLPYVLVIALFCTVLSQTISSWCMRTIKPTTISVVYLFSPVVSAFTAFVLIGETVAPSILLGGGVVLLGLFVYLMATERGRKPRAVQPEPRPEALEAVNVSDRQPQVAEK